MKSLSVVVPCRNEARRLNSAEFIAAVEAWPWISFCFVDDGSTDSTAESLARLARISPAIHAIYLEKNLGKAGAVREGVLHLLANTHSDLIGFWDADLATPLSEIPAFREAFETDANLQAVIGSRWPHLGANIRRSASRSLASAFTKLLIRRILGVPVWDTQCGAKVFTRQTAGEIFNAPFRTRWLFDVELLSRLGMQKLKNGVREHPLSTWFDIPGSKVGAGAMFELLGLYLKRQ